MSIIALTLGGDFLLKLSPYTSPLLQHPLYLQMKENKYMVGIGSWMVGNMIGQSLTSTGAFEVVYQGKVIFSKLEQNRMPTVDEILTPLKELDSIRSQYSTPHRKHSHSNVHLNPPHSDSSSSDENYDL